MKISAICTVLLAPALCLCGGGLKARAQQPSGSYNSNRSSDSVLASAFPNLLAQRGPARRPAGALEPAAFRSGVRPFFTMASLASGPILPVVGSGTLGRLTKWAGFNSDSVIGDSTVFEDKLGRVGIGTDAPTSRLTVAGPVESMSGGFKFPDGSVQSTAGVAGGLVVRSLNGLMGDLTLQAGPNIMITPSAATLIISATNALTGVAHDSTLTGSGAGASLLGVAIPLDLKCNGCALSQPVLSVASSQGGGSAVFAQSDSSHFSLIAVSPEVAVFGGDNDPSANGGLGAFGVVGFRTTGSGSLFETLSSNQSDAGVIAFGNNGSFAGRFGGNVNVTGTLSKAGGMFHIDHPLSPETKYLNHSFVESPDMKNIYDGTITTDADGNAIVALPDWFEALNKDFRYQLTVIGQFAQAIVSSEVRDNHFTIKTDAPAVKVSWQVTGIRRDAYANAHRIPVEEDKPQAERGYYLHPEEFGQPEELGIEWARHPDLMQHMKQVRQRSKQGRDERR
jgi:hypothetical protein